MRAENLVRSVGAAAVAAALLLAGGRQAQAQDYSVELGAGVSIPMAELEDTWQVGPSFGLGVVREVSDRVSVRADGELAFNAGKEFGATEAPDLTQFRYTGGVEMRFTEDDVPNWYTVLGVGAGAVSMGTDDFQLPGGDFADFTATYFTAYGAVRVGYRVNPGLAFALRSRLYLTTMSREETDEFGAVTGGAVDGFEEEWTLPTQLRVEFTL